MKHDAIVDQGIPIHERVPIPDEMIPADSRVEIDAKIQAGYFTTGTVMSMEELANVKGRGWEDIDVCEDHTIAYGVTKLTPSVALIHSRNTVIDMQGKEDASSGHLARLLNFMIGLGAQQLMNTQHNCAMQKYTTIVEQSDFCQTTSRLPANAK